MQVELWRKLLNEAFHIFDDADIPYTEWTFGGGTALMLYYNHRISLDIDIFLHDVNYITMLSPRLNRNLSGISDYVESSNFLKLKYLEGEIDFIIAPFLTSNPYRVKRVDGHKIRIETPEEIVLKKLFYRAEMLKSRDIFDTAVVFAENRENLLSESKILKPKYEVLNLRWQKIKPNLHVELTALNIINKDYIENTALYFETYLNILNSLP